jgi:hypothetical protein
MEDAKGYHRGSRTFRPEIAFMQRDLASIEPFEICSIRPPTENASLTFRLTRNCGWNQCLFCPVYKLGARFSRRSVEDVKKDVDRAKRIDDLLSELELESLSFPRITLYDRADRLVREIEAARPEPDAGSNGPTSPADTAAADEEDDERLRWFAGWFKQVPTIEDSVMHLLSWRMNGGETCFLGDANSLILTPDYFQDVVRHIKAAFPGLRRFTVYGKTRSAAKKRLEELVAFREAGLHRVHFGVESGSDRVLAFMRKGVTAAQHIEGCARTRASGISCSVYVMPGLGGMQWSEEHAVGTARVITASEPDFVRLRTLEIFPKTALARAAANGEFVEASEEQVAGEIRILIENIRCSTVIVSDSASNLLDVNGRLPADRQAMLETIDRYLSLSARDRLLFSFSARLRSFMGQYGSISNDIVRAIYPYLDNDTVDMSRADAAEIARITRLIRSKLMP